MIRLHFNLFFSFNVMSGVSFNFLGEIHVQMPTLWRAVIGHQMQILTNSVKTFGKLLLAIARFQLIFWVLF